MTQCGGWALLGAELGRLLNRAIAVGNGRSVAIATEAVAIGDVPGDPHRIDPDHHWSTNLHRELEANLVARPKILDLRRFSVRQSDERDLAVTLDAAYAFPVVDLEPATDLRNGNVRPRADEPSEAGRTRAL